MTRALVAALFTLAVALPGGAGAQGISSDDAKEILKELREIRRLLERMQAPPAGAPRAAAPQPDARVKVAVGGAFVLGRPDAPLTMVEFTDYECPFCRQFHVATFEALKKNYIDTRKMRYVSRDFPLDFHRNAMPAAQAARCAGEHGQFWQLRHVLLAIRKFARDLGSDEAAFRACLDGDRYRRDVEKDLADGRAAGVSGTPTFVLGRTTAEGVDGVRLVGAQPYAVFDAKIRELLADKP